MNGLITCPRCGVDSEHEIPELPNKLMCILCGITFYFPSRAAEVGTSESRGSAALDLSIDFNEIFKQALNEVLQECVFDDLTDQIKKVKKVAKQSDHENE
jgi:hypothetical protein